MTRPLSQGEADRCENAITPVCKCRCNGRFHGKGRVSVGGDFSTLPPDDPHYRPPKARKKSFSERIAEERLKMLEASP